MYAANLGQIELVAELKRRNFRRLLDQDPDGLDVIMQVIRMENPDLLAVLLENARWEGHLVDLGEYAASRLNGTAVRLINDELGRLRWNKYGAPAAIEDAMRRRMLTGVPSSNLGQNDESVAEDDLAQRPDLKVVAGM